MAEIRSEVPHLELAETIDAYYEHVGAAVRTGGGRVVKFEGDAALIVFPATAVDRGVEALLALKDSVDDLMARRGWECRLIAKVHFGTVDVIGKAVNVAALLDATGVTLSVEAFRKLGPDVRGDPCLT